MLQYFHVQYFHGVNPYYVETNPLNSSGYQWTGFYLIGISDMNELMLKQ